MTQYKGAKLIQTRSGPLSVSAIGCFLGEQRLVQFVKEEQDIYTYP